MRSRSRQNLLQDESEVVHTVDIDSETQSPANSSEPDKQRVRRTPGGKDHHAGKISAEALDSLMAST